MDPNAIILSSEQFDSMSHEYLRDLAEKYISYQIRAVYGWPFEVFVDRYQRGKVKLI